MICDARGIASDIDADICIVGAGPAGMTFAAELADTGLKIVLLESGGEEADAETQSLCLGDNIGLQYDLLERSRWLGGSSNCWGGWCKPLDPLDFKDRSWIPNRGWPFGLEELNTYYSRAHEYLNLGVFDYSEMTWAPEMKKRNSSTLLLSTSLLTNQIVQFSPPVRYGVKYRDFFKRSKNLNLVLRSNVTEIVRSDCAGKPIYVRVKTLSGNSFSVTTRATILAAGGIENARILLLSRSSQSNGLGNEHDLVGRYFMDHPRVRSTTLRIANLKSHRRLYDSRQARTRHWSGTNPNKIAAHIAPTPKTQRNLGLPNSRSYLIGRYAFENSRSFAAATALRAYRINSRRFGPANTNMRKLLGDLLRGMLTSPQGAIGVLDQALSLSFASRRLTVETIIEPIPNPESRVYLSQEKDQLGINRACLDWKLTDQDLDNIKSTTHLITSQLTDHKIATIDKGWPLEWDGTITGCWHHMGTTRMHPDPKKGVVDINSKLHNIDGIYCLGSSVFPTAGNDCPTITLVALSIRLADWFKKDIKSRLLCS